MRSEVGGVGGHQVAEGIYQVRGDDLSKPGWIRGQTGWIVVDPLTSVESATAAVALARKHLGPDPVVAVTFTDVGETFVVSLESALVLPPARPARPELRDRDAVTVGIVDAARAP